MGDASKLVIGFETNCVPDLNALLDDGEERAPQVGSPTKAVAAYRHYHENRTTLYPP